MPKIQEGSIILGDYRLDDGDKKPHGVPAFGAPDPFTICHHERVVHPFKTPVIAPGGEPAVNRLPAAGATGSPPATGEAQERGIVSAPTAFRCLSRR
jgi:hypothetical protein